MCCEKICPCQYKPPHPLLGDVKYYREHVLENSNFVDLGPKILTVYNKYTIQM